MKLNRLRLPKPTSLLKRHFVAGVFIVIPLAVIGWILVSTLGLLWRIPDLLPAAWQPETYLEDQAALITLIHFAFTVIMTVLLALGISILGWFSKQYLGQKALEVIAEFIQKIPVIRSIYSALDQLLKTVASEGGQQFHRVVYIEYPRKGIWTIAFVTGHSRGFSFDDSYINVYVPTTPNPTSGFYLIVLESEVKDSHLSVEEAFKTLLSLGIAQPTSSDESETPL